MFAIYLPGKRGAHESMLRDAGAGWACDPSVVAMFADVSEGGPDGGGGVLVYFDPRGRFAPNMLATIDMAAQDWLPAAPDGELPAGRYWVGIWKQQKPTPDDLQRATLVDGAPLLLRDGREWVIPIADYLPRLMTINRQTGDEELRPLPDHLSFIERTNEIFKLFISDEFHDRLKDDFRVVVPKGLTYAAEALAVNYRVGRDLVDMLGLIGEFEAVQIAGIATGLDLVATAEATQKKSPLRAMKSSDC